MQVNLEQAIAKLKNGEVVAIPTETVYGLAADATNDEALRQIYAIKQRPADNPLIVHIGDASQVNDWAAEFPPLAQKLAQAFWPGPFTLVLKAKDSVSSIVRGHQPTVALRVPNHPITLQLLKESGLALAAPSANKFTQLSPTTAAHVATGLGNAVAVLDGGACKVGIESTIVSVEGDDWQLLRLGMLPEASIEALAGRPAKSFSQPIKAPGQHLLHYSPKTPVKLFQSREALNSFVKSAQRSCAALLFGKGELPSCFYLQLSSKPAEAAEALYDALHQLDALQVQQLLVEMPPRGAEWAAIQDRLSRAAYII
jgi:L-threonylcarbamoyladenylate synthase